MTGTESLADALRREEEREGSGRLIVRSPIERGEITVVRGQIVAAESGGLTGTAALFALLSEQARVHERLEMADSASRPGSGNRMMPIPITLTLKRFNRLWRLWTEEWTSRYYVANDSGVVNVPGDPTDSALLLFFDRPVQGRSAIEASGLRPGGILERMEKLMNLGILVEIDPPVTGSRDTAISQFLPQITPEMIDKFVKQADADTSHDEQVPSVILLAEPSRWRDSTLARLSEVDDMDLVCLNPTELSKALQYPDSPLLLDASRDVSGSLSALRQVMLLAPRPVLWMYQDSEMGPAAVEALRYGAVGAWQEDHDTGLVDWVRALQGIRHVQGVRRLRYLKSGRTTQPMTGALGVILLGRGGTTAAIDVICNINPVGIAAVILLHWLPPEQSSALFQLIDRHSPFAVTQDLSQPLRPGDLLLSHWKDRRLADPGEESSSFQILSSIDDGTPDMWLSQLASRNENRLVVLSLGHDVVEQSATVEMVAAYVRHDAGGSSDLPVTSVMFDDLGRRFSEELARVGTLVE